MGYNHGDTIELLLDLTVDDIPLEEFGADEIEFYIGPNRYLLSDGDMEIDPELGKYKIFLTQEATFALDSVAEYQIRIRKGIDVVSGSISKVKIGPTISKIVI